MNAAGPVRVVLTGEVGSGKTHACAATAARLQDLNWEVVGILSPGAWERKEKVAIDALDLRSGETRRLAERAGVGSEAQGPATPGWRFSTETIAWCNSLLADAIDCDMLVVDELGPLEFESGEGLVQGLQALDKGQFRLGLIVVRLRLLQAARQRWPGAQVFTLRGPTEMSAMVERFVELAGTLKPSVRSAPAPRDQGRRNP